MVPYLESLPICTPRLFTRTMELFASIRHHKIARVFLVTKSTWVSISKDLGTILLHLFLVPKASFTGMSCATTLIGTVTTLVNFLHMIGVGPAHSPSSWVIISPIPPQFRKTWSILIGYFLNPVPPLFMSWTPLSYHKLSISALIQI